MEVPCRPWRKNWQSSVAAGATPVISSVTCLDFLNCLYPPTLWRCQFDPKQTEKTSFWRGFLCCCHTSFTTICLYLDFPNVVTYCDIFFWWWNKLWKALVRKSFHLDIYALSFLFKLASKDTGKLKRDAAQIAEFWAKTTSSGWLEANHPGSALGAIPLGLYGDDARYTKSGEKFISISWNAILHKHERTFRWISIKTLSCLSLKLEKDNVLVIMVIMKIISHHIQKKYICETHFYYVTDLKSHLIFGLSQDLILLGFLSSSCDVLYQSQITRWSGCIRLSHGVSKLPNLKHM